MNTVAIIQARMGSTRLPGKVLSDLAGSPVLEWVVRAARCIPGVDKVVVATTDLADDDKIAQWCEKNLTPCHRGAIDDVLSRYHLAASNENADFVMRLTGDCPLLDPHICGQVLTLLKRSKTDYCSNIDPTTWPDGLDCEAFTMASLSIAHAEATRLSDREHVTPFLRNNRHRFSVESLTSSINDLTQERWTLDTEKDFQFLTAVAQHLPADRAPAFTEVLAVLDAHPNLREINNSQKRNEGFAKSILEEASPTISTFSRSNALLERALKSIPLGSQTFSKSHIQYPQGQAPMFLTHGQGGRVWDVDGNEYVDMVGGLLPIVLGYRDSDVDAAIRKQLCRGISFSLATELEADLAERLIDIIPCAEAVRFGKNGSDATSAAIRLARAFTKRDRVAVCGYHGWQDWYIGTTTRHLGVPDAVRSLSHSVSFNDLDAVERLLNQHKNEFAAFILEPMNLTEPKENFLKDLKALLHDHNTLLIFDEVITGFRYALGGAQSLFGVTPDLAAFGKAMGNGMPISAIVGNAEIMNVMNDIFFSGTFGGEALSLAASIAVIDKMQREPVIQHLWDMGQTLADEVTHLTEKHGLSEVINFQGKPPWKIASISPAGGARSEAIKTLLQSEMLKRGVLFLGTHNICYAHNNQDMHHILQAYNGAFSVLTQELATGELETRLPFPAVESVFKVR